MAENIYNKTISNGGNKWGQGPIAKEDGTIVRGTLIGNWYEERALRTFTGVGRSVIKEHVPKKHLNFEEPIRAKAFDNTHDRIHGDKKPEPMYSQNYLYGRGVNPADALPKVGLKHKRLEQEMYNLISAEIREMDAAKDRLKEVRHFDTTAREEFNAKPIEGNTVGRWIMRTQDGEVVPLERTLGRDY